MIKKKSEYVKESNHKFFVILVAIGIIMGLAWWAIPKEKQSENEETQYNAIPYVPPSYIVTTLIEYNTSYFNTLCYSTLDGSPIRNETYNIQLIKAPEITKRESKHDGGFYELYFNDVMVRDWSPPITRNKYGDSESWRCRLSWPDYISVVVTRNNVTYSTQCKFINSYGTMEYTPKTSIEAMTTLHDNLMICFESLGQ